MERFNITLPDEMRKALDKEAKLQGTKRSTLIQKAVRFYLECKKRQSLENLMREGYQAMYGEAKELLEEFKTADAEAWKHVD